jgi:hypothetical protein
MNRQRRWLRHWAKTKESGNRLGDALRDIYPVNFLNRQHLNRRLFQQTIEAWIASDPKRGALRIFNDHMWLWHISHEQVPMVRRAFTEAGLLIMWNE